MTRQQLLQEAERLFRDGCKYVIHTHSDHKPQAYASLSIACTLLARELRRDEEIQSIVQFHAQREGNKDE